MVISDMIKCNSQYFISCP